MAVAHIVLLRPRPELGDVERRGFIEALERACHEIPGIRRFRVGRRVTLGAGYDSAMAVDYEFAAMIEFGDVEDLRAYLAHPAHVDLGAHFAATSESALVYDYEITDDPSTLKHT